MTQLAEGKFVHGIWRSKATFILAATGSAVGLGNIWKFPYLVGEHGGGAFILVYVLCLLLIGVPIMMVEVMLGRRGRSNPANVMREIAVLEGRSSRWKLVGGVAILTGFLILSIYSVIGGWTLAYVFRMASGLFTHAQVDDVKNVFSGLTGDAEKLMAWHSLFMLLTVGIIAKGVEAGLEKAVRYLMPALFMILLLLVAYAGMTGFIGEGLRFMFVVDFEALSAQSVLVAMGMAFFSLSIGTGALMMYGAYLPDNASLLGTTLIVAVIDLTIALLAGVAIFPIVLAHGMELTMGPGLVFNSIPLAFGNMQSGGLIGTLFFMLLVFAALTSAIALLEPSVTWLVDKYHFTRQKAAVYAGAAAWLIGLGTVFSFNLWVGYEWTLPLDLGKIQLVLFEDKSFYDIINFLTSNLLLPLAGLLVTIFAAYIINRETLEAELNMKKPYVDIWYFVLRYVVPVSVLIILLNVMGLLGE